MGGKNSKQRPEPVEGLDEDSSLSVVPVFRTSIRVRKVSISTNTFFITVKIFTTLYSIQKRNFIMQIPKRELFQSCNNLKSNKRGSSCRLFGQKNRSVSERSKIIKLRTTLWGTTDLSLNVEIITSILFQDSYTVPRITTLKLKKSHVWSVDSNILDYRGFYVFRKAGSCSNI